MNGPRHLRASRADREQVVEELKVAFVQERLTKDELDTRVGQALVAPTYADLDGLTADLPPVPTTQPARPEVPRVKRGVRPATGIKVAAACLGAGALVMSTAVGVVAGPWVAMAITIAFLVVTAVTAGFAALLVTAAIKLDERRGRRRLPPASGKGEGVGRRVAANPKQRRDGFSSRYLSLEPRVEPALL